MFFLLLYSIYSFDLLEIFQGAWNSEVIDMNIDGSLKATNYYGFNLTRSNDPDTLSALLYNGDFVPVVNQSENDSTSSDPKEENEKEALLEFEIISQQKHQGKIDVGGETLTEFKFVESFPNFLASYGKLNANLSYAVNIINLATIHISLFSLEQNQFREIVLTKYKPPESPTPWYEKYYNVLFGLFVFVVTYIALHFIEPLMNTLGLKGNKQQPTEEKKSEKKKDE